MPVNYNPADYINDFSWVGDIGGYLGKFATEMPELLELNKNLHENNKFKEMTYSGLNQFINNMDKEGISNIASSMGIDSSDIEFARSELKKKIPQFTDTTDNKQYGKQLVDSFIVPFAQAAMSDAGGGAMTPGQIFAQIPGQFTDAFAETTVGKNMQSDVDYEKNRDRAKTEMTEDFNAKTELANIESRKQQSGVDEAVSLILEKVDSKKSAFDNLMMMKKAATDYAKSNGLTETQAGSIYTQLKDQYTAMRENEKFQEEQDLKQKLADAKHQEELNKQVKEKKDKENPIVSEKNLIDPTLNKKLIELADKRKKKIDIETKMSMSTKSGQKAALKEQWEELNKEIQWLETFEQQSTDISQGYNELKEPRRNEFNQMRAEENDQADINRNTRTIDMSREWYNNIQKKPRSKADIDKQMNLMREAGVEYMYQVSPTGKDKYTITLKPEYKQYQKRLADQNAIITPNTVPPPSDKDDVAKQIADLKAAIAAKKAAQGQ